MQAGLAGLISTLRQTVENLGKRCNEQTRVCRGLASTDHSNRHRAPLCLCCTPYQAVYLGGFTGFSVPGPQIV